MTILKNDKLAIAQTLKDQIKFKEALETLSSIENVNELSEDHQIRFLLLQSDLFYHLGQFDKSLIAADVVVQKSIVGIGNA